MTSLNIALPLISFEETICELDFLERLRKGIVVSYQNRYKRKASPVKLEGSSPKRPRLEVTSASSATRLLLDLLSCGPISISQAAMQLQVKEKLIEQVVEVLLVVGHVSVANGLVSSVMSLNHSPKNGPICTSVPHSPKSPGSSCDDSYGPIPETPPQSMPMWDSSRYDDQSGGLRPYATRGALKKTFKEEDTCMDSGVLLPSLYQPIGIHSQAHLTRPPIFQLPGPLPHSAPPPTQPARSSRESDRVWADPALDVGSFPSLTTDKFCNKGITNDMSFDPNLDLGDSSIVDFFQSSFWDQY